MRADKRGPVGPSVLEQAADTVRRPEAQEGFAFYVSLRDGAEEARVAGVRAIIPHHEDVALRDGRRGGGAAVGELLVHVGFPLGLPVYQQPAAPDRDLVPRHAHHALYEVLSRRLFGPIVAEEAGDALDRVLLRRELASLDALEDDDVPALGLREAVDELVDEHPVANPQGRDHALRGDEEGLDDERPDEAEDQRERDEQDDEELDDAPAFFGCAPSAAALLIHLLGGLESLIVVVRLLGHGD